MDYIIEGIISALKMIISLDQEIIGISLISIKVSALATLFAALIGVPLGFTVAVSTFPGKRLCVTVLNTMMFFPSVLVGLLVYSMISRQGPLGGYGILYTPAAMIIGQSLLALPIITALALSATQGVDKRVEITALSLGANRMQSALLILSEGRFAIFAAVITGFSQVFSEVGVSMMLGGNIKGYTRNITTAIAMETGKGEFALGIALGIVLLGIALILNIVLNYFQGRGR